MLGDVGLENGWIERTLDSLRRRVERAIVTTANSGCCTDCCGTAARGSAILMAPRTLASANRRGRLKRALKGILPKRRPGAKLRS